MISSFSFVPYQMITLLIIGFFCNGLPWAQAEQHVQPWHIYLDADQTGARASGVAIERGIKTALREVDNYISGRPVKVLVKDHRGSSPRSKRHLEQYLVDENALVVFSGLHSPPLLAHRDFINENKILVLDPWAAAGPITRPKGTENWIFRLSIDDRKAGGVIVKHVVEHDGFKRPYLLLEETGWGKSNFNTMTQALQQHGIKPVGTKWFNWSLGENAARIKLREIKLSGADVILLVANAAEGKTFAQAMLSLMSEDRLPIRSHWGITGGDFAEVISASARKSLDLSFIQTRFSFINHGTQSFAQQVFAQAKKQFPDDIQHVGDIKAPTGFIHAYDLTRLLISAMQQTTLTGQKARDIKQIHDALETIQKPVQGLIKSYKKPFSKYSKSNPDAHEALSEVDYVMGYYGQNNQIILLD